MQPSGDEAKWISDYLEDEAQKPVLSELGMGKLREEYFLQHTDKPLSVFNEFKKTRLYIRSAERIAKHLQENTKILVRGQKRGKTYRHTDSRPMFTDQMIAKIIPAIVNSSPTELTWSQLRGPTMDWIRLLHESLESYPKLLDNPLEHPLFKVAARQIISVDKNLKPIIIDGKKTIQFGLKIDNEESKIYRKEFPAKLLEWSNDAYSYEWWDKSSSNIQSILKKGKEVVKGSKRGTWTHSDHRSSYGNMSFVSDLKDATRLVPQLSQTQILQNSHKQLKAQISTLDNTISDLISSNEAMLRDLSDIPIQRNVEVLRSELRKLHDLSDSIENLSKRISRFRVESEELIVSKSSHKQD